MSNTRKKTYKKRKQAAHTVEKTPRNVKKENKFAEFMNNWLWLISIIAIAALVAVLVIFIPMCDQSCSSCETPKACQTSDSDTENGDDLNAKFNNEALVTTPTDLATVEQFAPPEEGEQIVVLETSMGNIKLRLFPEAAPKACENFIGLVNKGYYDGLIIHRTVKDFVIQSGSPNGNATGGESIWGGDFEDEFNTGLHNYYGALSMANSGPDTNASQFFIVVAGEDYFNRTNDLTTLFSYGVPMDVASVYEQVGGAWWLDGDYKDKTGAGHTVFGQVFEGMDVAVAISSVEVVTKDDNDSRAYRPVEDVTIVKAYVETYSSSK